MEPLQNDAIDDYPSLTLDIDVENLPACTYVNIDSINTTVSPDNFS